MTGKQTLTAREKLMLSLAILFTLVGAVLQIIPGMKFSGQLSLAIAVGCLLWLYLCAKAEQSQAWRRCKKAFVVCLCAGLLLFCSLEIFLLSYGTRNDEALPADAVIVLGAGVNGATPSLALQTRLDAAAAYLTAHPDIPVILSGGQGPGEDITEALAMETALRTRFPDKTFLLEDKATSTAENFRYSKALLSAAGIDPESADILIVTNDFHMARACLIAQRQGVHTLRLSAPLPYGWLTVNYYIREAFALVKTVLLDW
ncbi:MAG: YdcF family protein [Oscillibacter sp.]|nr:YdcF family protein [Oscillibacter sp.]